MKKQQYSHHEEYDHEKSNRIVNRHESVMRILTREVYFSRIREPLCSGSHCFYDQPLREFFSENVSTGVGGSSGADFSLSWPSHRRRYTRKSRMSGEFHLHHSYLEGETCYPQGSLFISSCKSRKILPKKVSLLRGRRSTTMRRG